jgi:peptide/nickel transport system permease protein
MRISRTTGLPEQQGGADDLSSRLPRHRWGRFPGRLQGPGRGRHSLLSFVFRRCLTGAALVLVASVLVFAATDLLPGNAAYALLGKDAQPAQIKALEREFGLNKPAVDRYWSWIDGLAHGRLGRSFVSSSSVSQAISAPAVNTSVLAIAAALVMLPLSLALGVWTGIRPDGPLDHGVSAVSLGFIAVPEFVTGTVLALLLGVRVHLLPVLSLVPAGGTPLDQPSILVLPVATLSLAGFAFMVRMIRAGVIETLSSEYVEMARLRGIPERRIIVRHVLRNALAPSIQIFALTLQWLVGGLIVVETVFAYPGIGFTLVNAVSVRDIPIVQALAMLIAALYIGINIVADLVVVLLIPKLRTAV